MKLNLENKVIVITGGGGTLGKAIAKGFIEAGSLTCLIGRNLNKLEEAKTQIGLNKDMIKCFSTDVLDASQLEKTFQSIFHEFGRIDVLINSAGGNKAGAVIMPHQDFQEISEESLNEVIQLNLQGTIIPCKLICKYFKKQGFGNIINISSMAAQRPMTRVVGYAAAKAGIDNFTKWLAVELATKYGEKVRVNAIAPGFFIAEQNRDLLLDEEGDLTPRGKTIIEHTPMKRFGKPEELVGAALWLAGDLSSFVTGTIVNIDGGFNAFSGV